MTAACAMSMARQLRVAGAALALASVFASPAVRAFDPRSIDRIRSDGFESATPTPMALVSRNRPTFASAGNAAAVNDGEYYGGATWDVVPGDATPAWVAIHVGAGPTRACKQRPRGHARNPAV